MTTIKLHNTKSRTKEDFVPIDPENVRMYVCGPTVYDRAHLGNARPVVVFDVLYRLLRHVFGAEHVKYVRNFTDVDDKINATAQTRKEAGAAGTLEELVRERTEETIDWYLKDMGALGAMEPNHMPRATQYIAQMIAMNEDLIAKGHAYAAEGHVLFAVDSWKEHYGKLSGRSVDDMIAGARVEVAPYKKNPMDFVLWKPSTDEQPGWDSPWGRGRPGWHIECSAMAEDLLWKQPLERGLLSEAALAKPHTFDIHGGGNDLMFPHHENEIAQSCCAHGDDTFANYWLHNEMLQVEGKKMSKSLGNFFTVRDLLDQGVPGEVIRFVFLQTHYRKPMDWTEKKAKEARQTLTKIAQVLGRPGLEKNRPNQSFGELPQEFLSALADDLNTPLAITHVRKYLKNAQISELAAALEILGFAPERIVEKFQQFHMTTLGSNIGANVGLEVSDNVSERIAETLVELALRFQELRSDAMQTKNFSELDDFKSVLVNAGLEVRMSRDSVELVPASDFDSSKLENI
ncbi:cysteine--tRNA ligase [Tropicibacter sp. Alg240-R139]|uniref:cysteine--tRNA ligase n=1 Tax=Tropicibacter sp. Alg240-R139 TaxID=2305991 RepID=UPI0013DE7C81|nr:cysteine--tRNA ligase [Tropicibacter sp. Alg240-R139]